MESESRESVSRTAATASSNVRRAPAPAGVKLLRFWFGTLGRVLPGPATRLAYGLWFKTRRFQLTDRERQILSSAERFTVPVSGQPVAAYAWGRGPVVFMVHGWHGSAAHFVEFVQPLTEAGFRAVAFDAPAHGDSPGDRTTLPAIVDAMAALARQVSPIHALIAHSFGVMCATAALIEQRIASGRVICISPPAHMESLFISFSDTLGLPPGVQAGFRARFERDFGADVWSRFSPVNHAATLRMPALFFHDTNDRSVPIEEAELLVRSWSGARLVRTEKLGHRRILADASVIRQVVAFVGADAKPSS
jgi:pimeloyl-ACP methyl ester carboxylesterase